jgi:hypothetical protein
MVDAISKLKILMGAEDKASGVIRGVGGALDDSFGGKLLKGAGLGLAAVGTGLVAAGAGAIALARDAAPLKGVQDAFDGIADSAGTSGDEMLSALQKGSAGMITNRDLMLSYNKAAQLVSKDFAGQLPDAMNYVGKVAAATGQDMGFLMDSLVTGVGRLSPMILDNLGIQVDMVQASEDWAEANDRTVDSMTKTEQQTALMNQVMEKLAANTEAMPDLEGSAEQAFASFNTTLSNLKDDIGLAVLPIIQKLMEVVGPLLSDAIEKVMPYVQQFTEFIGQFVDVLLDAGFASIEMREVLENMFGTEIADRIMEIVDYIIQLKDTIMGFVNDTLIPFVQEHWEAIKTALIAVGAILAGAAIVSGILAIAGAIAALFNPITLIIGVIALLAVAWSQNWGGIQDKVRAAVDFIRNLIQTFLNWVQAFWAAHGEQITTLVQTIWDGIVAIAEWFIDYFTIIFEAFQAAFAGDWETFGEKLREAWDKVWEAIKSIVGKAWEWIKTAVSEAVEKVKSFFTETDWLQVGKDVVQGIANGIRAGVQWAVDAIRAVAQAIWGTITGFFKGESPSKLMAELGSDLMAGLAIGIEGNVTQPVGSALTAAQAITQTTQATILGGINVYGVENRESFLGELAEFLV